MRHPVVAPLLLLLVAPGLGAAPTPPAQRAGGPGGKRYRHLEVRESRYGRGPSGFWIFEPGRPRRTAAPVIVFVHGWLAAHPWCYRAWIDHLVLQGNVVLFPRYHGLATAPGDFTGNCIRTVARGLRFLDGVWHAKAMPGRLAIVGHSAGGLVAANVAALAVTSGLPRFAALMPVQPGVHDLIRYADFSRIPAGTLMVVVTSSDDHNVGERTGWDILRGASSIRPADRNLVRMHSDEHGKPGLLANHYAAACPKPISFVPRQVLPAIAATDALDYNGIWKLFDGLTDAAFHGTNRAWALGNTPEQRSLGKWSDGRPVRPMDVFTAGAAAASRTVKGAVPEARVAPGRRPPRRFW